MKVKQNQLYLEMFILTMVLTTIGSCFLVPMTWGLGGEWDLFLPDNSPLDDPLEVLGFVNSYRSYLQGNELESYFMAHLIMPSIALLCVSAYISKILLYVDGGIDRADHVSGAKLLQGKRAFADGRSNLKKELAKDESGVGVFLHPNIQITKRRELGNMIVFGQQGSGKGVVIKPLLKEIIDRNDQAIIYDEKREYTSLFLGQSVCLISPTDERSIVWNPSLDVVNEESAALLAESFISGEEDFWLQGARLIVTGCIVHLYKTEKSWGWSHLQAVLSKPVAELREIFKESSPHAAQLVEEGSKTTQGFMTIIVTQLAWVNAVATAWPDSHKSSFSIKSWVNGQTKYRAVIIPNNPLYNLISAPLCKGIIALSVQQLLALHDSSDRRIWFVLDELGNFPKSSSIKKLLTLGRSKGSRVIAGIQSISQLHKIYGRDDSETMLSLFSNLICLRLGAAGGSAKRASEIFGERTINLPVESTDNKGNRSRTSSQIKENVVPVGQITQLPQPDGKVVFGFLQVDGWDNVYSLSWPVIDIPQIADDYVPAKWLQNSTQQKRSKRVKQSRRGSRGRGASC